MALWAALSTGGNLIARGIMWGDSDADDWKRFPTRTMQASPEPVVFAAGAPIAFPERLFEEDSGSYSLDAFLQQTNTTALIILHGDEVIYEEYFNGGNRTATVMSFSAAKSFLSTLVGIAIDEGAIHSLDDPITAYVPELAKHDPRYADITLRHLITMSSGLRWERTSAAIDDSFISYYAPDLRAAALDVPIVGPPGASFTYNDYNPLLLGMALERATGVSVSEYMETRLWQPMGAEGEASWSLDSEQSGFEKTFAGLNGRAIDFAAKLGWLYLNEGRNGERQVVPAAWVEAAVTDATGDGYGYYWWIDAERGGYWAEGDKCQYIYVYPPANLVLARTGRDCGTHPNIGHWSLGGLAQWLEPQLAD